MGLKYTRVCIVVALTTIIVLGSVFSIKSISALTGDEIQKLGKERAAKSLDKVIDRLRHGIGENSTNNQTMANSTEGTK
jgi:hypothetical protein